SARKVSGPSEYSGVLATSDRWEQDQTRWMLFRTPWSRPREATNEIRPSLQETTAPLRARARTMTRSRAFSMIRRGLPDTNPSCDHRRPALWRILVLR